MSLDNALLILGISNSSCTLLQNEKASFNRANCSAPIQDAKRPAEAGLSILNGAGERT